MKLKSIFMAAIAALSVSVGSITAISAQENKTYETTDKSAPAVYFIRDITPEALVKVYKATRQAAKPA